jgi:hypothetical protein
LITSRLAPGVALGEKLVDERFYSRDVNMISPGCSVSPGCSRVVLNVRGGNIAIL